MVDNSTSPSERFFGLIFSSCDSPERVLHPVGPHACPCFHLHQGVPALSLGVFSRAFTLTSGRMAPAGGESTGFRAPSIVGSFSPLPWLGYVVGSIARLACPLALVVGPAP